MSACPALVSLPPFHVEMEAPPQLNSPRCIACVGLMASRRSLAKHYLEVIPHTRHAPHIRNGIPASPQFISSTDSAKSHTYQQNTVSPLCGCSKELAVLGFSLKLIRFIFSIISLVSRRRKESREGLETVREYWNGQVCL